MLLKHLIGLLTPDSGQILYKGKNVAGLSKADRKAFLGGFSYMFQGSALFDSLTVFDNIALPLREQTSLPENEIHNRVIEQTSQLDLRSAEDKYPSQISGGMQKRVALARALIINPQIILFDEPTTGLDPIRKNSVHHLITEYQNRYGFTGVVVSHEIPDIFYMSQRIAMLDDGAIIFSGRVDDLRQVEDPVVHEFIRGFKTDTENGSGLLSHRRGEEAFEKAMHSLARYQVPFSLVVLAIANQEAIAAEQGVLSLQKIIDNVALQVKQMLRVTDTCARYGLDKIMVVLPHTDMQKATMIYDKINRLFQDVHSASICPHPDVAYSVVAGFAEANQHSQLDQLVAEAERRNAVILSYENPSELK